MDNFCGDGKENVFVGEDPVGMVTGVRNKPSGVRKAARKRRK